jgi:hypothetical protein
VDITTGPWAQHLADLRLLAYCTRDPLSYLDIIEGILALEDLATRGVDPAHVGLASRAIAMPRSSALPHPIDSPLDPPDYSLARPEVDPERAAEQQPRGVLLDVELRNRTQTREFLATYWGACADLFDAVTTPAVIAAFCNWRVVICDREVPSLPEETLERASQLADELGEAHAADVRKRLGQIAPYALVAHAGYWKRADIDHECPRPLLSAVEPLGYSIASKVISKTLRMHRQTLPGHITSAALPDAHAIVDPGRWPEPRSAGYPTFAPARLALTALQYAAGWATLTAWECSGLKTDKRALEELTVRLKGD